MEHVRSFNNVKESHPIGIALHTSSGRFFLFFSVLLSLVWTFGCSGDNEDRYFNKAATQFERGGHAEAVETYEEYIELYRDGLRREEAFFRAGQVLLFALKKPDRAVHYFGRLITENPNCDYAYRAREIMAPLFADEIGNFHQAVLEYRWLARQRPRSQEAPSFLFKAAKCLLMADQIEEAILELGGLLKNYPGSDLVEPVLDELAAAYMLIERYEQTIFISKKFMEKFPDSPLYSTAELRMARAFEENQQYEDALKIYSHLMNTYENPEVVRIRMDGVRERWKAKYNEPIPADFLPQPVEGDETWYYFEYTGFETETEIGIPGERLNRSALESETDKVRIKNKILKEKRNN